MDIQNRNEQVMEYTNLIWWTIRKNRRLIKALRVEESDVFQDLFIAAMKAVEGFDPSRSDSMFTHVRVKFQYEILNIRNRYRPGGITGAKGVSVMLTSIERFYPDDNHLEIPDMDDYGLIEIIQLMGSLNPSEHTVMQMKVNGEPIRRKQQKADLKAAQTKLLAMIEGRDLVCC